VFIRSIFLFESKLLVDCKSNFHSFLIYFALYFSYCLSYFVFLYIFLCTGFLLFSVYLFFFFNYIVNSFPRTSNSVFSLRFIVFFSVFCFVLSPSPFIIFLFLKKLFLSSLFFFFSFSISFVSVVQCCRNII